MPSKTATDFFNDGLKKYNEKDFKGAIADYNEAIRLNPDYADAYFNRSILNNDLGNKQSASDDWRKFSLLTFKKNTNSSDELKEVHFKCVLLDKVPVMVVYSSTEQTNQQLIQWKNVNYWGGFDSALKQCTSVSNRFQEAQDKEIFNFIGSFIMKDKTLVCSSKVAKETCEFQLFEIPKYVDPNIIIEQLENIRVGRSVSPIRI